MLEITAPGQIHPLLDATPEAFADRAFVRTCKDAPVEAKAVRTLFKAYRCLALILGQRVAELRHSDDRYQRAPRGAGLGKRPAQGPKRADEGTQRRY